MIVSFIYINIICFFIESKFDGVKDKFIRVKYKLSEKLSKFEAFLDLKINYEKRGEGEDFIEKNKIEKKLEELDKEIKNDIKDLEKEFKAQSKKENQYHDLDHKEKILKLLKEKAEIIEKKFKKENFDDEFDHYEENIMKLDDFLKNNNVEEQSELRKLFKEEKDKIDEWRGRIKVQDEKLDEVIRVMAEIRGQAEISGDAIKIIREKVKKNDTIISPIIEKTQTQNERVKDLVNKIRSSDRICFDITLILILFGLICVLYSIIKHKY